MNANLLPGDWIAGHSSKATGHRLVYAMQLTKVLSMDEYFSQFPEKHPNPYGSIEQQYGDNMYFRENGRWLRLPSAEHNSVESFRQDQGRRVYLAQGENHFWYFGAANPLPDLFGFADQFPWLIQGQQGFGYIHDAERITVFTTWLSSLGQSGLRGQPRDQQAISTDRHLISIDPEPTWRDAQSNVDQNQSAVACCKRVAACPSVTKRGC